MSDTKKSFVKGFIKQGCDKGITLPKMQKIALHAHERIQERLQLPPQSADEIQKAVDRMWFGFGRRKLHDVNYYAPIKDHDSCLQGYAAFQRVGRHPHSSRLILTTVLDKTMKPRGSNIGHFLNTAVKADYKPVAHQPERFKQFDSIPDAKKDAK
ncbi:MAG: hypothetical protein EBU46_08940 [Nitrosomonadaceae bacterium]|nr:hypothetical protein [Nitrosomonadaceae bacterium]